MPCSRIKVLSMFLLEDTRIYCLFLFHLRVYVCVRFHRQAKQQHFLNSPSCSEPPHPGGRSEVTENVARPSRVARHVAAGASGDSLSLWPPRLRLCNAPVLDGEVCGVWESVGRSS